jgi:hypothetical protein
MRQVRKYRQDHQNIPTAGGSGLLIRKKSLRQHAEALLSCLILPGLRSGKSNQVLFLYIQRVKLPGSTATETAPAGREGTAGRPRDQNVMTTMAAVNTAVVM